MGIAYAFFVFTIFFFTKGFTFADAHTHVQRLVSVVKMATAFELCATDEKRSVMRRMFIKICFLFMVGNVCRVKRFTTGSRNSLKDVRKSQMMKRRCGSG
jgi:hypothetical protein